MTPVRAYQFVNGRVDRWPHAERLGLPATIVTADPVPVGAYAVASRLPTRSVPNRAWTAHAWRVGGSAVFVYVEYGTTQPTAEQVRNGVDADTNGEPR